MQPRTAYNTIPAKSGGYVALMATIIIAAILLVMSVEGSLAGFHARFNILGTEAKEQASSLAQGCADQALSAIVTDPSYTGNATTTTAVGTCYVFPVAYNSPVAGVVTIRSQAEVRGSFANLEMQINMSQIHIDSIPAAPTKGTVVVITNVINDGGGTNAPADFGMSVTALNPSATTFPGEVSGKVVTVDPGSYSITGTTKAGYARTISSTCTGTIISGAIKFCTITYADITTSITVLANVVNDNGGTLLSGDIALKIDGAPVTLGQTVALAPGAHTVTAANVSNYTQSAWGYQCSAGGTVTLNEGDNKTCVINFNDNLPPAPSCAETVMVLDRTGSMSSTDLGNEKIAANSLTDLYSSVQPPATPPRLAVGSIGGLDGSAASIPLLGQLSTVYTNIKSAITSIAGGNSSVGSDLSAGITVASAELSGPRHEAGKQKVLILVSDGDPNKPTGTVSTDSGFVAAASSTSDTATSSWSNASGAYSADGVTASGLVDGSANRERYANFTIGGGTGLPSVATVAGIEASLVAWATAGSATSTVTSAKSPTAALTPSQWSNPTNVTSSDNTYVTSATNGNQQGFSDFGFAIPSNAIITGIQLSSEGLVSAGTPQTTASLLPLAQGNYTAWTNGKSTIDETGTPDCSTADSIITGTTNNRESVTLDVSAIPNGSVITDVTVTAYDRGDTSAGGSYRTFARLNTVDTDAAATLTATNSGSGSTCTAKPQSINVPDTTKSAGTVLEIGVVKVSGNSSAVRIGALRATVTYTVAALGSYDVALSSDAGGTYTAAKTVNLSTVEGVASPVGNSASDLWGRTWVPGDFANTSFALRVQNTALTGTTISLDQLIVTVFYTLPVSAGTACSLGVDLSWNGGTSWSSEKTQNVTNIGTSYILGSAADDWSSSHTWLPTEFSNANFRARVRAIDPGAVCATGALDQLDSIQLKVYYTETADPAQAALNAADAAKQNGVNIFTIHFGSDPGPYNGKKLLANLANGTTTVTGHENGSLADTGGVVNGNTGLVPPTVQTTTTGGDNNGFEVGADKAFADGPSGLTGAAQNIDGAGDRHIYSGYAINVPPGATVVGIQTRLDWWLDSTTGTNSLGVELSWDGGTSWTTAKTDTNESTSVSNSQTLGGTTDIWGHTWTAAELSPANFRVRLTSNSSVVTRDFYLDWVPVTVYYSVNQENGDNDNFFVAPTSADMKGIFNYIGAQVCPALNYSAASTPPTTGQVSVITQVINNNGGSLAASSVSITVSGAGASPNNFSGSAAGTMVTLQPGSYGISAATVPNGYTEIIGAGCSSADAGVIIAGESRVCVLTYDDIPPPPPPPDVSIHLGTWKELPTAQ